MTSPSPLRPRHISPGDSRARRRAALCIAGALLALAACDPGSTVARLRDQTPHERYAGALRDAGLDQTAMGREWLVASDTVLPRAHEASLPMNESGFYDRGQARAVGWRFAVRDGQRVRVTLTLTGQPAQVFTDLFQVTGDSVPQFDAVASGVTDSTQTVQLTYESRDSVTLVLRVQPELLRGGRYDLTIQSDPVLAFPVEGRGNGAAQSFWGVDRDGGRRSHQGVDIFAPRGTPVLAATDGRIVSTRPNNLGGNVVWQLDDHRSQRLYYAHLDRHNVEAGVHVNAGDTIGFVGNTGNARTTAPHLHFGIYRSGRGAVDPWPYVRRNVAKLAPVRGDTARLGTRVQLSGNGVALRAAPASAAETIMTMKRGDTLQVVGAAGGYYRVELANGVAGYVPVAVAMRRISDESAAGGG